ncbi:hypothetical protein OsJ_21025 [Oryza sativa Japonica Group]|uniref:Uncharacterized protein n=1 Tax=Oryza sativa subsp. japonica TaxID=39947 RepID=Q5VME4_ORYSJ|nr:hypothetical protein OsJ_21025 [Oryza sativa Japonica Group]BAD69381.1 hypothetical protein [Oryza sativa Japonica Group]
MPVAKKTNLGCRNRLAEKGLHGAVDLEQEAEATEDGGAVPDLDREAEDRQLVEAYDAPADGVARSGWEGRSVGARGQGSGQQRRIATGRERRRRKRRGRGRRKAAAGGGRRSSRRAPTAVGSPIKKTLFYCPWAEPHSELQCPAHRNPHFIWPNPTLPLSLL